MTGHQKLMDLNFFRAQAVRDRNVPYFPKYECYAYFPKNCGIGNSSSCLCL
jgi:hypothetical protein